MNAGAGEGGGGGAAAWVSEQTLSRGSTEEGRLTRARGSQTPSPGATEPVSWAGVDRG